MLIFAVNAAEFTQSSTELLAMRVTAVRDCALYFCVNGKGVNANEANISARIVRTPTGGTPGSAITPTKPRSQDSGSVTSLATFLDQGSTSTGAEIDLFTTHPQFYRYSSRHELVAGEILDLLTKSDGVSTAKIRCTCLVWDRN